jgi:predicted nucleic acid-binding Zn finger protein
MFDTCSEDQKVAYEGRIIIELTSYFIFYFCNTTHSMIVANYEKDYILHYFHHNFCTCVWNASNLSRTSAQS